MAEDVSRIHKRIDEVSHDVANLRVVSARHDEQIDAIVKLGQEMKGSVDNLCNVVQEHVFILRGVKWTAAKIAAIIGLAAAVAGGVASLL